MPKATIIIATYNWSSVLPFSIGSALEQSVSDVEVLVVGDACTDESERVVSEIADPRVRWINRSERYGHQSGPNNLGLEQSKSDFIFYLGHDDLWLPHHVESHLATFEAGADIVYSIVARIPEPGTLGVATPELAPFRRGMWIPPTAFAHRKQVTNVIGPWGDYRTLELTPEIDLINRGVDAGFEIDYCARLTGIKLPASVRPGVYVSKPCDEQASWLNRIRSEPDLESKLLGRLLTELNYAARPQPIAVDAVRLMQKFAYRIRRRLSRHKTPKDIINYRKQLKGSDPASNSD